MISATPILSGDNGAIEELARDYETADPSYMAVPDAIRYWQKYHPGDVSF